MSPSLERTYRTFLVGLGRIFEPFPPAFVTLPFLVLGGFSSGVSCLAGCLSTRACSGEELMTWDVAGSGGILTLAAASASKSRGDQSWLSGYGFIKRKPHLGAVSNADCMKRQSSNLKDDI
jgi:hypothetical protein